LNFAQYEFFHALYFLIQDLIIDELHDHVIQLMDEVETWTTDRQTLLAEKDEIARERNSLRADLNKFYERSANHRMRVCQQRFRVAESII